MELKNYMEKLVMEKLDIVIKANRTTCNCERCRYDIAALALNSLPTRYVATSSGATYSKIDSLDQQFHVDIVSAITQAITIVKKTPHH
ncbi:MULTISPECIES: late competence development ComFB family protein [Pelosinus]|uniref:Late competence development protein ComFB n=1 Tax=Pelosinus fermentans B4 TaxID=1149862 RepID=I9AZE8_9FIRM|nr:MULTISPECIES: late competence development ComFB family protein [Pelosinus]EIW18282.1 Late competence development protein ComFB [Pelosinus fermentans B4]EIW24268.1 Late competence development protein ComFB [Pelosinus fermentans A11]OAM94286.1 Late competence development protein ComFB [Pelosinus fermentans DSM 17108]SDR05178.1 competence protein ComFB [Pelosinus fermentans]